MTFIQSAWSLNDLFPGIESHELQDAFIQLEKQIAEFEESRPELVPEITISTFLSLMDLSERFTRSAFRIYGYASLSFAADTQGQNVIVLLSRVQQFMAEMQNRILFFSLWWKDLDDVNAARLSEASGDYRYYLDTIRKYKLHALSEAEEKIINLKNVTGADAIATFYTSMTNRFIFKLVVEDVPLEMTRSELISYVRQVDPDLRARAYQELFRVYTQEGPLLGQLYQTLVRDCYNENVLLRNYSSPLAARNFSNDISDDIVDTLMEVSQKNTGIFQHFFKIKARRLGLHRLRRYDVYAPIGQSGKVYDFNDSVKMVLESFNHFEPVFCELALRVLEKNHLDSEIRLGKESEAFCITLTPQETPWVLVNFQNQSDDAAALAHELGHAIHSMLADQHSVFTQSASLPLAEAASAFAEMLLVDHMLSGENDLDIRRELLFSQVDDAYVTTLRQIYFALFEKQAHGMIRNNASVDELSMAYLDNLKHQFGDAVDVSDDFKSEWFAISHIYTAPFYVYAYAFGQLLVFSLYKQYKTEGAEFKPRYMQILAAGGSESTETILARAGIDLHSAAFWQGGFDVIRELVDQLDRLVD